MRRPFQRTRGGIAVGLDDEERAVLARLLLDVHGLLEDDNAEPDADPLAGLVGWSTGPVDEPDDPAVARLLPPGHHDDPELAAEFRRLTQSGLRDRKRAGLALAAEALTGTEPVVLDADQSLALLKGLTDVRLVLAQRLGIETEQDAEHVHTRVQLAFSKAGGPDGEREPDPDPDDGPWLTYAVLYDALSWWQEALVGCLHG